VSGNPRLRQREYTLKTKLKNVKYENEGIVDLLTQHQRRGGLGASLSFEFVFWVLS
jgi:hypothetical protein